MTLPGGAPFLCSPFVPAGDGEITVKSWGTDSDRTKSKTSRTWGVLRTLTVCLTCSVPLVIWARRLHVRDWLYALSQIISPSPSQPTKILTMTTSTRKRKKKSVSCTLLCFYFNFLLRKTFLFDKICILCIYVHKMWCKYTKQTYISIKGSLKFRI